MATQFLSYIFLFLFVDVLEKVVLDTDYIAADRLKAFLYLLDIPVNPTDIKHSFVPASLNCVQLAAVHHLACHFVEELDKLKQVMEGQKVLKIFSSSLLISYDSSLLIALKSVPSEILKSNSTTMGIGKYQRPGDLQKQKISDFIENNVPRTVHLKGDLCDSPLHIPYTFRMIDFCHSYFDLNKDSIDSNYLHGVNCLRDIFLEIAEGIYDGKTAHLD